MVDTEAGVLMFLGNADEGRDYAAGVQTWLFRDGDWAQQSPTSAAAPPARNYAALARFGEGALR